MLFNKRRARIAVGIVSGCMIGAFLGALVIPIILSKGPSQTEQEPQRETAVQEPDKETRAALPPRDPPEDVRRRELPPELAVPAPAQQVMRTLPPDSDKLNTQWTEPLAMPVKDPVPPDPFTSPPIAVDPARRPEPDVARQVIE